MISAEQRTTIVDLAEDLAERHHDACANGGFKTFHAFNAALSRLHEYLDTLVGDPLQGATPNTEFIRDGDELVMAVHGGFTYNHRYWATATFEQLVQGLLANACINNDSEWSKALKSDIVDALHRAQELALGAIAEE